MKTKILSIIIFFSVITFGQFVSNVSKKGTTAAPFLSISQGARATAMGSAFVGLADDPSSIYWNPSGIAKMNSAGAFFDHTDWFADIKFNFVSIAYPVPGLGSLGLSFTSSSIGEMRVTTIDEPGGTGETFNVSDVAVSLTYAINLTDNFSIGFNPKYIQQTIWKMSASAFAMDLGVQYITPFDGIVLAMSISNFGTKMKLNGNSNLVLHDLNIETTGNNGNIPAHLQTDEWALPLNYRVGLGYTKQLFDSHVLRLALDAQHPNDNYESINVGAEWTMFDMISLRGGYKSLFLQDSEESFTLGFGVQQYLMGNIAITFDYAYADFGRLSNIQKFSIGVKF
ncbi:MAG: PorV/PorQ family protein [Ignavibacteriaceae bacterium]|nr:PorV/PorQ family protein [Ignavibacteriaceae bacterium]